MNSNNAAALCEVLTIQNYTLKCIIFSKRVKKAQHFLKRAQKNKMKNCALLLP